MWIGLKGLKKQGTVCRWVLSSRNLKPPEVDGNITGTEETLNTEACSETKPGSQMSNSWWRIRKREQRFETCTVFSTYEVTKHWAIRGINLSDMKLLLERWPSGELLLSLGVTKFLHSGKPPNMKNPVTVEAFRVLYKTSFTEALFRTDLPIPRVQCLALYLCTYQCAFCWLQWKILLCKSVGAIPEKVTCH